MEKLRAQRPSDQPTTRPTYYFPLNLVIPRIPSFLFGQHRSLQADVTSAFEAIQVVPRIIDAENIPLCDPFLLVMNHYHRHDIPAWWPAMAVYKAVAERRAGHAPNEVRQLIASQWTYANPLQKILVEPLTRLMISRIARAYNFLTIEPVALGTAQTNQRARSIRQVLEAARRAVREQYLLGLAPEGGDSPEGALVHPPAGAGRFMLFLAATGLAFLPVGTYAENNILVTRFGKRFQLQAPPALKKSELDEWLSCEVMLQIARLLPEELRGIYQAEL